MPAQIPARRAASRFGPGPLHDRIAAWVGTIFVAALITAILIFGGRGPLSPATDVKPDGAGIASGAGAPRPPGPAK